MKKEMKINVADFKKFIEETFISNDMDIEEQLKNYTLQILDLYFLHLENEKLRKDIKEIEQK